MNTCLLLNMSLNTDSNNPGINHGQTRADQYSKGISQLLSFDPFWINNNIQWIISDNTINEKAELKNLLNVLPNNTKYLLQKNNVLGKTNKGAGLIEQLKHFKDEILNYKWVIYYEPRQYMKENSFIKTFVETKSNLFYIHKKHTNPHVWTGIFACESTLLIDFIQSVNIEDMIKRDLSIEYIFYNFLNANKILYNTIEKIDLQWHDVYQNRFVDL